MPLLGTDQILAQEIISATQTAAASLGYTPDQIAAIVQGLQPLASGIAQAVIQHIVTNAQVASGIIVATSGGAGATAGPGVIL